MLFELLIARGKTLRNGTIATLVDENGLQTYNQYITTRH